MFNSLTQQTLKLTLPGVPDVYQGTEVIQLTLVDPDNRTEVDSARLSALLASIRQQHASKHAQATEFVRALLCESEAGSLLKLHVTHTLLQARSSPRLAPLFTSSLYEPLSAEGMHAAHVLAFRRWSEGSELLVCVTRWYAALMGWEDTHTPTRTPPPPPSHLRVPVGDAVWSATCVRVCPKEDAQPSGVYTDLLTGARHTANRGTLPLARLFQALPVCVLTRGVAEAE